MRVPRENHGKPLPPRPPLRRLRIPDRLGVLARAARRPVRRPRSRRPGRAVGRQMMRAMRLHAPGRALSCDQIARPEPGPRQLLLRVRACGVCRTDLHVVDGELPEAKRPLVPGHEIVAEVAGRGRDAARFREGERVGVPWLGMTCGECEDCRAGRENLCARALFTGYTLDGGYAEYALADERYCLPIPDRYSDMEAAPLLCAGLIGYRCYKKIEQSRTIGIYGFGAAAHIVAQVAKAEGRT